MLTINLVWDANALAAPQSFRTAVEAAASILEAAIYDPITVNIGIGYGEYDNGRIPLTGEESLGGVTSDITISYSLLRAALTSTASSATDLAALAALPSTTALNGQTTFEIGRAQAKVLGALSPTDPGIDGYAGFPTSFTGTTLTLAAITELLHAMDLLNGSFPLSLFEYTSPGVHLLTEGTAATPAYFSLDGGKTDLANYDVGFDSTLFSNPSNDPLSAPISGQLTVTTLDLEEIGAIGYDVTSTTAIPTATITPATTAAGTAPTLTVKGATVPPNWVVPVSSFIKSASVATGDSLGSYAFFDQGTDSGRLVINGVVEPIDQWVYALSTQLGSLDYVAGSTSGTDTIDVYAIDTDTNATTPYAIITVTTTNGISSVSTGAETVTTTNNANGSVTIVTTPGSNTVQLGAASATVTSTGTDTIDASTGSASITTSGNAVIVGSTGPLTVKGGAGNDVVIAGPGGVTFTGGSGFDTVVGGGYPDSITGGTGGGLFQGGGSATITAGAGGVENIVFGSNGDQMYGTGPSGILFGDSGGNASKSTLMSSAGDTGNSVFFGASGSGHMTLITGSGNDLLAVGQGTNSVSLGSGTDVVFANGAAAGSTTINAGTGSASIVMGGAMTDLVIAAGAAGTSRAFSIYNDASSTDKITLTGYASTQISSALATQVNGAGGSILTLSDGTTLALVGVQTATASLFA
jgi:hypothetical protein